MRQFIGSQILHAACYCADVAIKDFRSRHKPFRLAAYRHACSRIMRQHEMSYGQIGALMCRDHTTVIHSCLHIKPSAAVAEAERNIAANIGKVRAPCNSELEVVRIKGDYMTEGHARKRVAPFPPGGDRMLLANIPKEKIKQHFPEWRL